MELTVGKKYRVTDQQGNCLTMRAVSPYNLEIVHSYIVGYVGLDLERFKLGLDDFRSGDLTITPIDDETAPKASAQPDDQPLARYAALLEMLQAITAGIYYRQPYGQGYFDPEQALIHIGTRLAAFEKGSQQ